MNDRARVLLLTALFCIGGCGFGLWYFRHDHDYVFKGPRQIEAADLLKLKSLSELPTPWVRFAPDEVIATEGELYAGNYSGVPPLARVYLVRIQDRWMLGLLNTNLGESIEGKLLAGRPYYKEEFTAIARDTQDIHKGKLLPFELHGYDDRAADARFGYYFLWFCGGVGAVSLMFGVYYLFYPPQEGVDYGQSYLPEYEADEAYSYGGRR